MMNLAETRRDLMAPDTEPTDEELHCVMREALDLVLQRKGESDAWMRRQMAAALQEARKLAIAA